MDGKRIVFMILPYRLLKRDLRYPAD